MPQFHEGEDEPYQVFTTFVDITDQIRIQRALEERIKELHSLARISRIIQQENQLQDICNLLAVELVRGMQYSELAVATINLDGQNFTTNPIAVETPYRQIVPIQIENEVIGQIKVFIQKISLFSFQRKLI